MEDGGKKNGGFGVTLLLASLLVVVGVLAGLLASRYVENVLTMDWLFGEEERTTTATPVVVEGIRDLDELSTVQWTESVNITRQSENNRLPDFLRGERVLLVAVGEVRAGVDLGEIGADDVRVQDERITIELPEPEVLSTSLDEERTRIYDRDQGLLNLRPDDTLVDEARREAELAARRAAEENGIREYADDSAENSLRAFVETLGFEEVRFE